MHTLLCFFFCFRIQLLHLIFRIAPISLFPPPPHTHAMLFCQFEKLASYSFLQSSFGEEEGRQKCGCEKKEEEGEQQVAKEEDA